MLPKTFVDEFVGRRDAELVAIASNLAVSLYFIHLAHIKRAGSEQRGARGVHAIEASEPGELTRCTRWSKNSGSPIELVY